MNAVTHLEKVITGEVSAVTHLEKVITGETSAVTYTEKVITGEATPITHLQKVIAGIESPVTHLEYIWAGGSPTPTEHEYTGAVPHTFTADGSPLISWRISGNTLQSATPTPDNPIMPEGTGERTAQLIDYPYFTADGLLSGVTWVTTIHSIKASGITTGGTNFYLFRNKLIKAGTYRMTINGTHKGMSLLLRDTITATMIANLNPSTDTYQFTLESDMLTCSLYFNQSSANVSVDIDCTIMLNEGSTPLTYEPYGYKLTVVCGGTITTIYIGTNPLRKSLDGTAVDELSSNGTLTQRVDTDGSVLPTPIVSQIDTPAIPTVNGSNTFDVDTTVKPSEIYIKYKGV